MHTNRLTIGTVMTLIAAYLGLFIGLIDANAVNLALPAIGDDLGGEISGAQWTIDAYNVTFAALLLTSGSLGDRFGRRSVLRVGLVTFVLASLLCASAASLPMLLAARAVQGVGAALMLPQGLAITAAAFPNPIERGRATAGWAMAAALSTALGPILGGVLTDTVGWRYIFWLNVPIGVVALALTYRFLPESRDTDADRVDVRGQALAIFGLAALTALLVEGRTTGRVLTGTLAFAAATCLWLFVSKQRRSDHPMLPLDLFRSRALAASLVSTFTMTFGIYGLLFVNSFAFQQQRGATTLSTALWFLPMPVTYLLFIPVVNAVGQRIGPRWPITVGLVVMAAGMAVYSAAGPQGDLWALFASFVVAGVGLAVTTGPAVTLAMSAVPVRYAGLASGVVNLARLVGITVGVAVLGTAMDAGGARIAVLTGALVQLVGAVLALRWSRTEATSTEEVCYA